MMARRWASLCGLLAIACAADPTIACAQASPTRAAIIARVRSEAEALQLPPDIAEAVSYVETDFDPTQIGSSGERGVMQVMPQTAAMLGFKGTTQELADVDVNVRYGVRYLAAAWRLANHDLCRALTKYRAGHGAEFMSEKSVAYCRRARVYLAGIHSTLELGAALPALAEKAGAFVEAAPRGAERPVSFWAREKSRVRRLDARVEAQWARNAARNRRRPQV